MQYFNNIDESIDVNKLIAFKECIICHYCYFLIKAFKFQQSLCNSCHNVLMMLVDIDSITVIDYYYYYH